MKKRWSIVYSIPTEDLQNIVKTSESFSGVLRHFDLKNKGGNIKTLKRRLDEEKIDYSHIPQGKGSNKNKYRGGKSKIPLSEILVKNSTYHRGHLKDRLIEKKLLKLKCALCEQGTEWKGKRLVLVLDHINGESDDHRLKNLRMLCPNCNSQQSTFAGKRHKKPKPKCNNCNKPISKHSKLCQLCSNKEKSFQQRKVKNRPSKELLKKQINELGYCETGRRYGVSDNTVRKWLKQECKNVK